MSFTPEQIRNLLEFKAVSKALKQRYPFIKKVIVPDLNEQYTTLEFLDVYVNPYEMAEEFDSELESFVKSAMSRGSNFSTPFPAVFFKDSKNDDFVNFEDELTKLFRDIHNSPALPQDVKLPGGKRFAISEYIIDPNTKIRDEKEV